jgi:hypothetical protein
MTRRQIHCQVLELPVSNHLEQSRSNARPRDLLPWADPYIAALLEKVERRENNWQDAPRAADDRADVWDDDWTDAAINEEHARFAASFPLNDEHTAVDHTAVDHTAPGDDAARGLDNVYGGWPLLDDLPRPE